jgi:hypothetical protein
MRHADAEPDIDPALNLIERRWFASHAAVRECRARCDLLREVIEMAESEWRNVRARLERLEVVHEALGRLIESRDAPARAEDSSFSDEPARLSPAA